MLTTLRSAVRSLFVTAAVAAWLVTASSPVPIASAQTRVRPKLVVMIMVDQFRGDYVSQFHHQWTGGLRRLIDEGSSFPLAAYPYQTTVTCAGHATVSTGSMPATHGMIGNSWFDRGRGRMTRCTEDPDSPSLDYGTTRPAASGRTRRGESAWRLKVPTLADELRAQLSPAPRVVTMSIKQRSAIMLAGQRGDAVTWLDAGRTWTTSKAFAEVPVPFMQRFLAANPIADLLGQTWSRTLPADAYLFEDDEQYEQPPARWTTTFPHPLEGVAGRADRQFYLRWRDSPYSDDYLGGIALASVDALDLGQRDSTDFLGISFSALDFVGHQFGPRSHEVQDTLVRLDRTIGTLLDTLDRRVGAGNYVVALSSDHGVSPIPEWLARQDFSAGRIRTQQVGPLIEAILSTVLDPGRYVARVTGTGVYFREGVYERLMQEPLARQLVEHVLGTVPGIARVLWRHDVAEARDARDEGLRLVALSYHATRSPDLIGVHERYWMRGAAASHGTSNMYDRRVPLILYGGGIRAARHLTDATPADIAPTLAYLTGVTLSRPDGRVLEEAFP